MKWCQIDTLLLRTSNRKYYVAYRLVPFAVALDDLEGHSPVTGFIKAIRRTFVRRFAWFQLTWRVARSLGDS